MSEVVDRHAHRREPLLRADILHDVGHSLNPAIDLGQIEGGFIQGMGWLTTEELVWNDEGRLTHARALHLQDPGLRPTARATCSSQLWDKGRNVEDTIHRSKAVGEPPLMLAHLRAHGAVGRGGERGRLCGLSRARTRRRRPSGS